MTFERDGGQAVISRRGGPSVRVSHRLVAVGSNNSKPTVGVARRLQACPQSKANAPRLMIAERQSARSPAKTFPTLSGGRAPPPAENRQVMRHACPKTSARGMQGKIEPRWHDGHDGEWRREPRISRICANEKSIIQFLIRADSRDLRLNSSILPLANLGVLGG